MDDDKNTEAKAGDFIREIVADDIKNNKNKTEIITRFPPEPNGYLHIGHAKAITIDFGIAEDFGGRCHLRFDDTNPAKEESEYVESILKDIKWLGFDWAKHLYYASDYFDKIYEFALILINKGLAYIDNLNADEIREHRGTLTKPGKNSPYRDRSVEENLSLFEKMKNGDFPDGSCVLRAKIDMASPNMNMRDPVMYRILHKEHYRTGGKWNIYPMYDWAHGLEDSIEGITHSLCSLEYEDHRPLYNWFLNQIDGIHHPRQIEFARLNLNYTVMSKRKLLQLVAENKVLGWDDPRMPTISGLRRRGFTPESIRDFCSRIGIAKVNSTIDIALLEHCLRENLNKKAYRKMAVLKPLKVIITNFPDDHVEYLDAENNPEDSASGARKIAFTKEIYIEQDDFKIDPPKQYFRLSPGKEIRLKHAYYVTCTGYKKDDKTDKILEVYCTYDPDSKGGWTNDGRKVKGTSHWVSANKCINAQVRIYDRLFIKENPEDAEEGKSFLDYLNPDSYEILNDCFIEESLKDAKPLDKFQFLRLGYFCADYDTSDQKPVFNLTVSLKDTWGKIEKKIT